MKSINQTFDGVSVYNSAEEQAANLFYFLVKDHVFQDGNKRIAVLLFTKTLEFNGMYYNDQGVPKISDELLAVLAILLAESSPHSKDQLIQLIMTLLA